jgi:hypothetical protein
MSALIDEFKKEHSEIIATLNEVEELGILSREGLAKLVSVKASLLEHLWNEDEQLYPVLRKEAGHNKKLKEILDVFANDTENIYGDMLEFFGTYTEGAIDSKFTGEFEHLFATLRTRIRNEENFLYSEYEKIDQ